MSILITISNYMIPCIIFYIVGTAWIMKIDAYDVFVKGARKGIDTVVKILPTLLGLMVAVGMLRGSLAMSLLEKVLGNTPINVFFPVCLIPLSLVKMFSSSAAVGLLNDIYREYGTDSYPGLVASLLLSSTETIFYTMSIYYMTAGVKKTRWTLPGALIATLAGTVASVIIASLMIML